MITLVTTFKDVATGGYFAFDPQSKFPIFRKIADRAYTDVDEYGDSRIISDVYTPVIALEFDYDLPR